MVASRPRPKGGLVAPFGLCTFAFALVPASIGPQDLVAMFARKAAAAEYRQPALASPFGTIHQETFRFPRPPGARIPAPFGYRLASLDPRTAYATGSIAADGFLGTHNPDRAHEFPRVNRSGKGDRLPIAIDVSDDAVTVSVTAAEDAVPDTPAKHVTTAPADAAPKIAAIAPVEDDRSIPARSDASEARSAVANAPEPVPPPSLAGPPEIEAADPPEDGIWPVMSVASLIGVARPATHPVGLYFGVDSLNAPYNPFEWSTSEVPFDRPPEVEADIPLPMMRPDQRTASDENGESVAGPEAGGRTVAGKGEVTGKNKRPRSPAERLALSRAARAKAEKCLSDAVYFEARGESVRGQIAVAQVVMNRVFSQFYPDTVCSVVYQNAHRRLACQFTFACDGTPEVVNDPDAWQRAKRIANDTLDGKLWLNEIGKATHYHASWVHPWWVRTMRKLHRIGVHTFYRPKRWGDGADEPVWGSSKLTAEIVKKL